MNISSLTVAERSNEEQYRSLLAAMRIATSNLTTFTGNTRQSKEARDRSLTTIQSGLQQLEKLLLS